MKLWIRSQDRKELYIIKDKLYLAKGDLVQTSITPYETEQHYEIRYNFKNDILGEYKSKERALEVLDEIQEFIEKRGTSEINVENGITNGIKYYNNVYNMPKE